MAEDRTRAVERLCKGQGGELDFLRETVRRSVHWLMEEEMGAGRWERTEERTTYRNGLRHAQRSTLVAALDRAIPKLRSGSYFFGWLEPRRRSEQALVTVVAATLVTRRSAVPPPFAPPIVISCRRPVRIGCG